MSGVMRRGLQCRSRVWPPNEERQLLAYDQRRPWAAWGLGADAEQEGCKGAIERTYDQARKCTWSWQRRQLLLSTIGRRLLRIICGAHLVGRVADADPKSRAR